MIQLNACNFIRQALIDAKFRQGVPVHTEVIEYYKHQCSYRESKYQIWRSMNGFVVRGLSSEGANWWLQVESLVDLYSHHMQTAKRWLELHAKHLAVTFLPHHQRHWFCMSTMKAKGRLHRLLSPWTLDIVGKIRPNQCYFTETCMPRPYRLWHHEQLVGKTTACWLQEMSGYEEA